VQLTCPPEVRAIARTPATSSGAQLLVTDDVDVAVRGADFVYTDVWVSMGESEEQWDERVPLLEPYRVTVAGKRARSRFGLDGVEVEDAVVESDRSIVFDQAGNRLHTIKAVMVSAPGS
jgi:ornithine carbamoyltransferase